MYFHTDFGRSTLSAGIAAGATSFSVQAGDGAKFPTGPHFVTIWNSTDYACADLDPDKEIVYVSSRATDTFTVAANGRGFDGTDDENHNTGGKTYTVQHCLIAREVDQFMTQPRGGIWKYSVSTPNATGHMTSMGLTVVTAGTVSGTTPTSTTPNMANYLTAATTGQTAGYGTNGISVTRMGRVQRFSVLAKYDETANLRAWIALTTRALGTLLGSDIPIDTVGFRRSTIVGEANWQCYSSDGTTTGTTDSGIAFDTNLHRFDLEFEGASTVRYYIDGVLVATRTTPLPASGTNIFPNIGVLTNENVAKNLKIGYVFILEDLP
jgi:hypothetical protein